MLLISQNLMPDVCVNGDHDTRPFVLPETCLQEENTIISKSHKENVNTEIGIYSQSEEMENG